MSTQIDTSTSASATWAPNLPTVLLASDGTALVFYYDGTEIVYRSAASPYTSWSGATTLTGSTNSRFGMSALINGDDSVYLLYPGAANGAPFFNKLTKSGSAWTQGSRVSLTQLVTGGVGGTPYGILKDDAGRVWFVYQGSDTAHWGAAYSTDNGATWTDSVTAQAMGNQAMLPSFCMAGSGRYVVVCYTKNDGSIYWRRCDTHGTLSTWSTEQSATFGIGPDYYYTDYLSLAQDGAGRIVAVMGDNAIGGFGSGVWGKVYTPGTDTWGADTHLGTTTGATADGTNGVFAASNGTDVYALYTHGVASNNYSLVYKKWTSGSATWDSSATQLEASGSNIALPNAAATTALLGFAWTQGTGSPYSVEWDTFSLGGVVSGGGSLVANAVLSDTAQIVAPGTLVGNAVLSQTGAIVQAVAALIGNAALAQPNGAQIVAVAALVANAVLLGPVPSTVGSCAVSDVALGTATLSDAALGSATLSDAVAGQ